MTEQSSGRSSYLIRTGTLTNADRARVDPRKLTAYSLNLDHPVGRDKAIVFERVLGFNLTNWEELRDRILEGIQTSPATPHGISRHGPEFSRLTP